MTVQPDKVLVFHTAFIGDIVLMFPMLQALRHHLPGSRITVVVMPAVADLVRKHAAVDEVIAYDKRGAHRGWGGMRALAMRLKEERFSAAIVPHRSLRSALVVRMAAIPRRIGFTTSTGARFFTERVTYVPGHHEIDRNLALLEPMIGFAPARLLPAIGVESEDQRAADALLAVTGGEHAGFLQRPLVALAPGSVWATKRWPAASFAALAHALAGSGCSVVLVGGSGDVALARAIAGRSGCSREIADTTGKLSLAGSAALLRRCGVLVTNDSAPMHLASGVGTAVVALFGPTVPAIGFAPVGPRDRVLEVAGLPCRPCNIHGGNECPIGSFACMHGIAVTQVLEAVHMILADKLAE